ncbi:unnamed protein product [Caenorhabditis angaria]|uniref:MRG domain-containing protein n=1 Tax=Caenorhabditis angaria TaxID=860376 RepID=A0A9P1NBA5_9PELO|nr:unnamed protein product [Caenorhabditis angaria]
MAPHYKAGTKIFSKRRGEMFLAQIVKVNVRKNPADPIYTIRYVGKYSRYPEKVKHSESSRKFIKSNMNPIAEARYLMDGCAGTDSRDQQIQHQPSKPSAPGSSRRSREEIWGVDPPKVPWAPTVFRERELQLSEALVEVLKKNSEMIRHKYLPKLPAKFTVAEIIKEFENSIDNRPVIFESIIRDNFLNRVFIGIFNKILRKQLISEFEYHQLDQFEKSIDNFKPSEYYGIAPLIRCLEHYFKDRKLNFEFYMMFKDLMSFLRKNLIKFYYGTDYYELSPEDYIDVAPRKRSRDSETPTTVSWGIPRNLQYASDSECEEYFSENEEESGFLTMPVKLKEVLKMSSEKIRQKYLPILPAEITVVQIIKDFEESLGNMPEKSDFYLDREKFRNFFWVRLIDMFNMQHRALLISEFEYFQLDQFIIEKKSINPGDEFKPSEYYGIVPLIRCLEHFIKNRIVDFDIKGVVKKFMWYLVKNCSKYFSSTTYYELAPEDYQEIVPRKRARRSRSTVPPTTVPVDLEVIEPSSTSEIVKVEPLNQENISTVSSSTVLSSTVLPDALKTEVQDDLEIFDPTSNQFLNFHFQRSDSTEVEVEQNFERILCLSLTTRATTTVSSPTVSSPTVSSPDIKVEDISDNESEVSSSTPNLVKLSPTPTVPSATICRRMKREVRSHIHCQLQRSKILAKKWRILEHQETCDVSKSGNLQNNFGISICVE